MQIQAGRRPVIVGAILIVVGVVAAAAVHPSLGAPIAIMGDLVFWPVDGLPGAPSSPLERLFAAVAGGLMTGWGAMFVALGRGWSVGKAIATGAAAWFVVDSVASAVAGVPLNVVGNVPFLALMLWAIWPSIRMRDGRVRFDAGDSVPAR
jgi:hypothetical protein